GGKEEKRREEKRRFLGDTLLQKGFPQPLFLKLLFYSRSRLPGVNEAMSVFFSFPGSAWECSHGGSASIKSLLHHGPKSLQNTAR
ncbi:MAG: hypothetical protein ACLQPD_15590, partial [Desulfomonilaceae bacterium]